MPLIAYQEIRFQGKTRNTIERANQIIAEYAEQGYDLTLRQLYYQFVARGLLPNRPAEYDRLGQIVSRARLAGLIDWTHIVDRTREVRANSHWDSPADILASAAETYHIDRWHDQPNCVEVWIEKDALVGVIEGVCRRNDVAYFSSRGYSSQSAMWRAAQRFGEQTRTGKMPHVLHLADHDPSGVDMTRDIRERLELFLYGWGPLVVNRIALTMAQVEEYGPPPNPAKETDTRAADYIDEYGAESWELDALEPAVLEELIEDKISELRDDELWEDALLREADEQGHLRSLAAREGAA